MSNLYVITIFDKNKPRTIGIRYNGKDKYFDLYRHGANKLIKDINKKIEELTELFISIIDHNNAIIFNDLKSHYYAFPILESVNHTNIYDNHIYLFDTDGTFDGDKKAIKDKLNKCSEPAIYQNVLAKAARVYKAFETNGVLSHYTHMSTKWSNNTFTGRSKCSGFNVQGAIVDDNIRAVSSNDTDIIVALDWLSADFRMASILSNDKVLESSFFESDPYTYLMDVFNLDNDDDDKLSRSETKIFMLRSINGILDNSPVFDIYKNLGVWINTMWDSINAGNDVKSILGRVFKASEARNSKSLINSAMQGSTAHAMHAILPRLYDVFGDRLITEIHDSIPIMCHNDVNEIKTTIKIAKDIMMRPFDGILEGDIIFPVKVSIGKWKAWREFKIYRK